MNNSTKMTLVQKLRGRAQYLRDLNHVKSPQLMEQAADLLEYHLAPRDVSVSDEDVERACEAYDDANLPGEEYSSGPGMRAALQAAIQSLEVTPELVKVYCAAVNEHLGSLTKKQWLLERTDPVGSIERAATIGLTAVLSALKEQAK